MLQELKTATLMGGAVLEMVDHELMKVFQNIVNPNTKPGAVRQVTLVIKIKPNDKRNRIDVSAQAVAKLVPDEPVKVEALVERAADGSVAVMEMFRGMDHGRTALPGVEPEARTITVEPINPFNEGNAKEAANA